MVQYYLLPDAVCTNVWILGYSIVIAEYLIKFMQVLTTYSTVSRSSQFGIEWKCSD